MIDQNQKATSRGIILELIYNICSSEAAICHDYETLMLYEIDLKEKEETYKDIKDSGEDSPELNLDISEIKQKIDYINSLIQLETASRRIKQDLLESLSSKYDKRFHCKLKHWSRVIEHDLEILESYKDYNKIKDFIILDFKNFALTISLYLGIEYSDCYRCIADKFKIENK